MNRYFSRPLNYVLLCIALVVSFAANAQDKPTPTRGTTYTVKPDYRKCAYPMCGGWFLTPVNQYSLQLEDSDKAYQNSLLLPNTVYVANIDYKLLGLTPLQIQLLETSMRQGQALLRGNVTASTARVKTLVAENAWTSPNTSPAVGPYLKVSSSGIVCITTPCPYYKAELINTNYLSNFDELTFGKAGLDRDQEAQAWQAVASDGLVITGVKYESQGQTGTGTGISATKVFFAYPPTK